MSSGVPADPTGVHRGLPSRDLTLVLEVAAAGRRWSRGTVAAHGIFGGLHTRPALTDASTPQDGVQYALSPLAASALFGVPTAAVRGLAVDLEDILGGAGADLIGQVASAEWWRSRFELVDAALLCRLSARPAVPGEVAEAWRVVFANGGRASVAGVADHVGWSRRHLGEQFRLVTRVTFKTTAAA